jgi:hypothetical protein
MLHNICRQFNLPGIDEDNSDDQESDSDNEDDRGADPN